MENTFLVFTDTHWEFQPGKSVRLLLMYEDVLLTTHDNKLEPLTIDEVTRQRITNETEYIVAHDHEAFDIIVSFLREYQIPASFAEPMREKPSEGGA